MQRAKASTADESWDGLDKKVGLVIDEDGHRLPLAQACHRMLRRLQEHYTARPGPLERRAAALLTLLRPR